MLHSPRGSPFLLLLAQWKLTVAFEKSSPTPHQFLTQLVGGWAGKTRTWLEPEGVPIESQTQGSIQLILDGRFALYLYQTSIDDKPQHGLFTFGYNTTLDRYESSWVDSFHNNTAIMFCTGNAKEKGSLSWAVIPTSMEVPTGAGARKLNWLTQIISPLLPITSILKALKPKPQRHN